MPWNPTWELDRPASSASFLHDVAGAVSRQRKLALLAFAIVFAAIIIYGLVLSDRYHARMEILVADTQLRRAEPVQSSAPDAEPIVNSQGTEYDETLNSEIALLRSPNVIREVVRKCGLANSPGLWYGLLLKMWNEASALHATGALRAVADVLPFLRRPTQQELNAKAMARLAENLHIEVLKMSDVISVTYSSNNPKMAARVLNAMGNAYLKEHALAHYPPGELKFFREQTDQAQAAMKQAQNRLTAFTQSTNVASGRIQMDDALRRLSDETAGLEAADASIAATKQRIQSLQAQASQIPQRQVTELKSSDSSLLLQNLKSSLLNLETKRTALLTEYQPSYPLVVEVNQQIAQTRAAIAAAHQAQLQSRTTNRDPNYEMVREDLTRSKADLSSLYARASTLSRQTAADSAIVDQLQRQSVAQRNLMQNAKAAESNYGMLLQKEQEAKLSDALDKQGVFNVSVAQRAFVPVLPVHSVLWYLLYGGLLSILCALATAVGADRIDPRVRTLDELESMLQAPVLAILPPIKALPRHIMNDERRRQRRGYGSLFTDP